MRFFPREKGKTAIFRRFFFETAVFPFLAWEKSHLAGGRKSGSLISVPLARRKIIRRHARSREVLHGVGADGVGVKFPIFAVNCCCLPLFMRRKRGKMRREGGEMR